MSVIFLTEKTSGHISSMITLAQQLLQNNYTIYFLISNSTHERDVFKRLPYNYSVYTSLIQVNALFNRLKPNLIINTGGRFAYPIVVLARLKHIKSFTIEQNYYPGLTNVLMSPFTTIYATQLEYKKLYHNEKVILHPPIVRSDVLTNKNELKNKMGIDLNKPVLVVLTGTNGNKEINDLMEKHIIKFVSKNIHVIWQIGIKVTLEQRFTGVTMVHFIDNIYEIYAIADYVLTSSGINTINELLSLDIPFKLIPYRTSQFDHQYHNALYTNNIKLPSKSVYTDDYTGLIDTIIDKIIIRSSLPDIKITYPITSDISTPQPDDDNIFYLLLCSLLLYMKFLIFIFFDGCITKKIKGPLCSNYAYSKEIPQILWRSIILAEDGAFMFHNGYPYTFKNFLKIARLNFPVSGIVQQLIKNMYFQKYQNKYQKIFRKVTELILTYFINKVYSKQLIIEYYLNCLSYIDYTSKELPYFGIKNICRNLFHKNMAELDLFEIVFISVTLPNPVVHYNSFINKQKISPSIRKKMIVHLNKGKTYKKITEAEESLFMEKLLAYT